MLWWDEYQRALNARDDEALAACFGRDAIYTGVSGRTFAGADWILQYVRDYREKFSSDYVSETLSFLEAGDRFAAEWKWRGTHDRDGLRGPATGKSYTINGASIGRVADGKIREVRDYWDTAGFLLQLGVASPRG